MIRNGKMDHFVESDGSHYVHIIPVEGVFDIYYQIGDSPLEFAYGLPNKLPNGDVYDLHGAFINAWVNFPDYEWMFDDDCCDCEDETDEH